ncbi:MAG: M56 family metallopeptidase, partial [Syntrophomonadaceae bacterium]|nr:M56 family metallopeptidase [Syntrophomonadaceae bacterium]
MLEGLFKGMLNISLYASVVAVVIMLIKMMCGRRLSPDFHYGIWSLFLLKLVLPLDIKSVFSIFTLFERVAGEPVTERIDAVLPPIDAGALAQPAGLPSPGLADGLPVASPGPDLWSAAAILWLAGVAVMLAALVFSYLKTGRTIRASASGPDRRLAGILSTCRGELDIRRDVPVCTSGLFDIPFIFGFARPMIVLPGRICSGLPDEGLKAVLAHELMHIRRKDHLVNLVLFLVKSVHWFNPVVWLACRWMKNDGERACDSAVINGYSAERRGEYARALVEVAAVVGKRAPVPAVSAFTEGDFKGRV